MKKCGVFVLLMAIAIGGIYSVPTQSIDIKAEIGQIISQVKAAITQAVSDINSLVSTLKKIVNDALTKYESMAAGLAKQLAGQGVAKSTIQAIQSYINTFTTQMKSEIKTFISSATQAIKTLASTLSTVLNNAISGFVSAATQFSKSAVKSLVKNPVTAAGCIASAVPQIVYIAQIKISSITTCITPFVSQLQSAINSLPDMITQTANALIANATYCATLPAASDVTACLQANVSATSPCITNAINNFLGQLSNSSSAVQTLTDCVNAASSTATTAFTQVASNFTQCLAA